MAGVYRIRATKGALLRRGFAFQNSDRTARDFTGFYPQLTVTTEDKKRTVLVANPTNAMLQLDPSLRGRLNLEVTAQQLPAAGAYVYVLALRDSAGNWLPPYLTGVFSVKASAL